LKYSEEKVKTRVMRLFVLHLLFHFAQNPINCISGEKKNTKA